MNASTDIHEVISGLKASGEPFALATVVRTISVTSAKAGAKAVIGKDGSVISGWIGGGCAHAAVLKAAHQSIEDGAPRLVSIQPEDLLRENGVTAGDERDGVKFARNMCPSQGTMDIFVEPVVPQPQIVIFGSSPVAVAVAALAKPLGFDRVVCTRDGETESFGDVEYLVSGFDGPFEETGNKFIVIATQGQGDETATRAALRLEARYVAFVGSRRKAESLVTKLRDGGVSKEALEALKAPAGLDLNAITPEEIALSILAEIVQIRREEQRTRLPD